jgi:hypothetical protein
MIDMSDLLNIASSALPERQRAALHCMQPVRTNASAHPILGGLVTGGRIQQAGGPLAGLDLFIAA